MIVKNEERTLPRLFASLAGQVDYYVVSDTGSTDSTIEVLGKLGKQYGIPGEIHCHEWRNFAHNRNLALEAAIESKQTGRHSCSWLMFMDADEEFEVNDPGWKNQLSKGKSYSTYKQTEDWAMKYPFLVWLEGNQWIWKGEIHNYILQLSEPKSFDFLNSVAIIYHSFEGAKSHRFSDARQKAQSDIIQLVKELGDTPVNAFNAFRYFQLAFAYRNAEEYQKAIEEMERVAHCPGVSNERHYAALIFVSSLLQRTSLDPVKTKAYLETAIEIFPQRKEAYFYLSNWYRQQGKTSEAFHYMEKAYDMHNEDSGALFLERNVYTWRAAYQFAFMLFRGEELNRAAKLVNELLASRHLPESEKAFIEQLGIRIASRLQNHQTH
jgi:glycosyltransferase involved in cell wall biosynthesis